MSQEAGLLAGRFHEGGAKIRPHDAYRDARKPSAASYVGQFAGLDSGSCKKQLSESSTWSNSIRSRSLVPMTFALRRRLVAGHTLQAVEPPVVQTQPPRSRLRLYSSRDFITMFHVKRDCADRVCIVTKFCRRSNLAVDERLCFT